MPFPYEPQLMLQDHVNRILMPGVLGALLASLFVFGDSKSGTSSVSLSGIEAEDACLENVEEMPMGAGQILCT